MHKVKLLLLALFVIGTVVVSADARDLKYLKDTASKGGQSICFYFNGSYAMHCEGSNSTTNSTAPWGLDTGV